MHYIAYHSYTFAGFMRNEFEGTDVSGAWPLAQLHILCPEHQCLDCCLPVYACVHNAMHV